MIPIEHEHIFSAYICLWLILLAVLWIRHEYRAHKADWSVVKEKLYLCDRCHHSFLAGSDQGQVTRCPRCNALCFIRKRKRF